MTPARPAVVGAQTSVVSRSLRAMASPVTLSVVDPGPQAQDCLDRAEQIVREVERTCSRFDPTSALSRANDEPDRWHTVPATLAAAVQEAGRAHRESRGLFDPRILDVLLRWGYDRSLPFESGSVDRDGLADAAGGAVRAGSADPWQPEVVQDGHEWLLHLGGRPIDLGGIGKGLAVRWAAAALDGAGRGHLVDAGGDCALSGAGPDGGSWRVGVEDPAGGPDPVLVLEVTDTGCATSSTRLRHWRAGGERVHHLVDPRTRRPGGAGLAAVTVLDPDPAWAEVLSKCLFLAGAAEIRDQATDLGLAAAWVGLDGTVGTTTAMERSVTWRRADV
ncbi:FAD:protein FMN transferase [Cellulomonas sp. KRMCY2]|uniref:FAD:protein FMN transferase n=1 Tax=Cellulomonas sp. KRMCY2 TaxID=1304865 RepID=UPI00045E7D32|nr:FAD:protein FMN transferase [Cellulomonas sp. KRMCY2]